MRRQDESGAVVPFVALMLTVLLVTAAFVVDLGVQRVARRDMQALADMVALDLARLMGTRTTAELDAMKGSAIAATVARNDDTVGDPPQVAATFGELDADGDLVPVTSAEYPTAVEVTAATSVAFAFVSGEGGASRSALAEADKSACLKIGSVAAAVDSGDSSAIAVLNGLLGQALGVDLLDAGVTTAGYQGLARGTLSLVDLVDVADLHVATVDELLVSNAVTVGTLTAAMITVLAEQDPTQTAAVAALEAIEVGIGPIASEPVHLGALLGLEQGNESALALDLNVLDLLTSAVLVADGSNAVAVRDLGLSLGLSSVTGDLAVIEAPALACGRSGQTTATSQQASLDISGTLLSVPPISVPLIAVMAVDVGTAGVHLGLAGSRAALTDISCRTAAASSVDRLTADVTTGLLAASVTVPVTLTGKIEVTNPIGPPSLATVTVKLTAKVSSSQNARNKPGQVLALPPNDTSPKKTGAGNIGLSGLTVNTNDPPAEITATVLDQPVSLPNSVATTLRAQVQTAVETLLAPTLAALDNALIGPVSDLLGLEIDGADLYGEAAVCNDAVLRG